MIQLNVHHPLSLLVFFVSYKNPNKQIMKGSRFYQKIMQWKDFCIHFVKLLYEGSEPIGSQWGGFLSVKEDSGLWYFTVCNFLLCVILIYHFIASMFPVSCFGMRVAHWFLVWIHPSWCPCSDQSSALNMAHAWYSVPLFI